MTEDRGEEAQIREIHSSGVKMVLAISGAGSGAFPRLLSVPGGSRSILEAIIPYCRSATDSFIEKTPESYCCEATAAALAQAAAHRASALFRAESRLMDKKTTESSGKKSPPRDFPLGLGVTASLVSDRPKKGAHRIHLAIQTDRTVLTAELVLEKGARNREEEERVASDFILIGIASFLRRRNDFLSSPNVGSTPEKAFRFYPANDLFSTSAIPPSWTDAERPTATIVRTCRKIALLLAECRNAGEENASSAVRIRGENAEIFHAEDRGEFPRAIFPGSFNPIHRGHRRMIEIAEKRLGTPVALEISLQNVDKPPLGLWDAARRFRQIRDQLPKNDLWLTRFPLFYQKADFFRSATFLVGADTLRRLADPRYSVGFPGGQEAIFHQIVASDARFLTFARKENGRMETLSNLDVPPTLRSRCLEIPPSEFVDDLSSTILRQERGHRETI